MTANVAGDDVRRAGREVAGSRWVHWLSRAGLVARGAIYLLIGSLAVQIGFGNGGQEADRKGALETVAARPGGAVVLWLLAIGFVGLALWRYAEAAYGQPSPHGGGVARRLFSFGHGVFYSVVCGTIVKFALGAGAASSDQESKSVTAKVMAEPGGRWLVLAVGVGFVAVGIGIVVVGLSRKFTETLRTDTSPRGRRVLEGIGLVGHCARGLVFGAAGIFLGYAAITFDPDKAQGLDGSLRAFAGTPAGRWALVAVAAGLLVFGVYSCCEARWRKVEAVRS